MEGYICQLQTGDCSTIALHLWVNPLVRCRLGIIHSQMHSARHRAGETVGNPVTLSELHYKGELTLLTHGLMLRCCSHHKLQGPVVDKSIDRAGCYEELEVRHS